MSDRTSMLRWALPPGVSLVIHVTLVVLLVVLGSRAAGIVSDTPVVTRLPLAELEFTAPPPQPTPQNQTQTHTQNQTQSRAVARADQPERRRAPSVLDQGVGVLAPTPVSTQAMSVATLDELARQSSTLSAEPSNAPAPISFAGVSTGAVRSIVYVIDTSGATLSSLSYIGERLLQSIDRLSPTQRFDVIAFRRLADSGFTSPPLEYSKNTLPRATRANKQIVSEWLSEMHAQGKSNPVEGIEAALELKPDMILLISRGIERTQAPWAGGLKNVRQRLDELNPINTKTGLRPVVIKTIQLLNEDPTGIMRTIGVFHGDGHNDHQVVTYNQLVSPEPPKVAPPTSNTDARLTTAEEQLASLKAAGAYFRATTSVPTLADAASIDNALIRINAMLAKADPADPRTALLLAEAFLLKRGAGRAQGLIDLLTEAVFISPDLDARRRIVLAQLQNDPADLVALLEEQPQLNYAQITAAHAVLALGSFGQADSQHAGRPPFTTDPAWAIMLAEARVVFNLKSSLADPLGALLELRNALPLLGPQIDASIVRLVNSSGVDPSSFSDFVRLIIGRARISTGEKEDRFTAISRLLELSDSPDQEIAQESLWLACLGARALNTRDSSGALMIAAAKLAERFPEHPGAPDALAGAIDVAGEFKSPNLTPLLRQAIALYPTRIEIDLWRLELINRTTGLEQQSLIESLTPATRESDLGAQIYNANALGATPESPLAHAIKTAGVLDRLGSPLADQWNRAAAELEVDTDPASAVIRLWRFVQKNPDPDDPELEILYARALLGAGEPERAMARLTLLAGALNANPTKHFWHAWAIILETIIRDGNAADKESALAHLTRLRLIDQNLGPEPFRSRLIKASNTLHSEP